MYNKKDMIAFWPYNSGNAYVKNMISIWRKYYKVVPFDTQINSFNKIQKCKAIIFNWYESTLSIYKLMVLCIYKYLGIKIIWVFHNRIPHDSKTDLGTWLKMQSIVLVSDRIISHSKNSRKYLRRYGKEAIKKAVYVPHINYCENYKYTKTDYREQFGITENDFVYMFFGGLEAHKNIELLIQVFNEWNKKNTKLLITGMPKDKEYVKKLKGLCRNENIIIKDKCIPNSQVYAYFNTCDVVVMPYHKHSYLNSGVMINAFSCGRTVIAPDIPMVKDMNRLCYMYKYNKSVEHKKALIEAMKRCNSLGRTKNHSLGELAKEYVIKYNSAEKITKYIETIM